MVEEIMVILLALIMMSPFIILAFAILLLIIGAVGC